MTMALQQSRIRQLDTSASSVSYNSTCTYVKEVSIHDGEDWDNLFHVKSTSDEVTSLIRRAVNDRPPLTDMKFY